MLLSLSVLDSGLHIEQPREEYQSHDTWSLNMPDFSKQQLREYMSYLNGRVFHDVDWVSPDTQLRKQMAETQLRGYFHSVPRASVMPDRHSTDGSASSTRTKKVKMRGRSDGTRGKWGR
jgi:hypothetical protein